MRHTMGRLLRAAAAVTLVAAAMPLATGTATASQGGDDHKVTLCHRTNSEHNPYVVITIDKAGVFKVGHDGHDEGGVHQPGDKDKGIRWGDIIPAFDYFASPQDEKAGKLSHYAGLNLTAEGQDILANGCKVPGPVTPPEPSGNLTGECPDGGGAFTVSGTLDADGADDAEFRLSLSKGGTIPLSGTTFTKAIDAPVGTTVQLQFHLGSGDWVDVDGEFVKVKDCTPVQPAPPVGSFTVICDTDGGKNAVVTIGPLDPKSNAGSYEIRVTGGATTRGPDRSAGRRPGRVEDRAVLRADLRCSDLGRQ